MNILNKIKHLTKSKPSVAYRYRLFFLFIIIAVFDVKAQNKREELEVRRQKLLQQIENINNKLKLNEQYKAAAEDRLEALQDQIETREALINNLHEEILTVDSIVNRTEEVIVALNDDMDKIKREYVLMLRKAYRMRIPNNALVFLMSSKNFDEAYKRWQYFKQYDKFKKKQTRLILETQKSLTIKNTFLNQQKIQKETLATTTIQQKALLVTEKKNKDRLIESLENEKVGLSKALKTRERKSEQLNATISRIIAAELEERRRAAEERARRNREEANRLAKEANRRKRRTTPETPQNEAITEGVANNTPKEEVLVESSEYLALSSDFRSNRGKLPPPVAGNIVRGFGKQKVMDKVTSINNGIDIRTTPNANVNAVFNGTVSIVSNLPGLGYVVLIQHGSYYTVYSGLSETYIKKGDTVSTRQTIGKAGINAVSNAHEVHFEVWLERTQLNPSSWIVRE